MVEPAKGGPVKHEDDPRSTQEILRAIVGSNPVELEPKIDTLDRPLVIECACPGWQPREWPDPEAYPRGTPPNYEKGGTRYDAVPCSYDEQAAELVEAVEAGCAATHVHPRDPADCLPTHSAERLVEIYDRAFESADFFPIQHAWSRTPEDGIDFVEHADALLELGDGSNKYIQGSVVLWPPGDRYPRQDYAAAVREGLTFFAEHDIKPIFKLRGSYQARKLHRTVVEGDMPVAEPMAIVHDMGHPYGWPMDGEEWMPIELISSIEQTRKRFADMDTVIGVYSGNRNWLPVTMMAILAGVDMVRVGIEDPYWMYPHRDEVIRSNIECVRKIVDFCELIDRELATPEQTRELLGTALT